MIWFDLIGYVELTSDRAVTISSHIMRIRGICRHAISADSGRRWICYCGFAAWKRRELFKIFSHRLGKDIVYAADVHHSTTRQMFESQKSSSSAKTRPSGRITIVIFHPTESEINVHTSVLFRDIRPIFAEKQRDLLVNAFCKKNLCSMHSLSGLSTVWAYLVNLYRIGHNLSLYTYTIDN